MAALPLRPSRPPLTSPSLPLPGGIPKCRAHNTTPQASKYTFLAAYQISLSVKLSSGSHDSPNVAANRSTQVVFILIRGRRHVGKSGFRWPVTRSVFKTPELFVHCLSRFSERKINKRCSLPWSHVLVVGLSQGISVKLTSFGVLSSNRSQRWSFHSLILSISRWRSSSLPLCAMAAVQTRLKSKSITSSHRIHPQSKLQSTNTV